MALHFITSNAGKFAEAASVLNDIEPLTLDLPEIQSLDAQSIIEQKVRVAAESCSEPFFVEDQSLYFEAFDWVLPGPFIKWFYQGLGNESLVRIVSKLNQTAAKNVVLLGYSDGRGATHYFEGEVSGTIVAPVGTNDFAWGALFKPQGSDKTYGQMTAEEKMIVNPRIVALKKLKDFLDSTK